MNPLADTPMPARIAQLPRSLKGYPIPHVAAWSSEATNDVRYEAGFELPMLFSTGRKGEGEPLLGEMEIARQRDAFVRGRCQVCAAFLPRRGARWIVGYAEATPDGPMIREPWGCPECLAYALAVCPGLIGAHRQQPLRVYQLTSWTLALTVTSLAGLRGDGKLEPSVRLEEVGDRAYGYAKLVPGHGKAFTREEFLALHAKGGGNG
jgi:hypothetical protein